MDIVKNKWVSLGILAAVAVTVIVVSLFIKDKVDEKRKEMAVTKPAGQ